MEATLSKYIIGFIKNDSNSIMTELYHNYKSRIHRCYWQNSSSLSLCA